MSAKIVRLQCLERIRRLQEEMERAALQRAFGAIAEVETALHHHADEVSAAKTQSRAALGEGDRREFLFADAQDEVARSSISRLSALLPQREAAVAPAMERYVACRRLHEQAKVLLANVRHEEDAAELKRTQAETDDWVVSRWATRAQTILKDS